MTGSGGFSGAPKLQAAVAGLLRLRAENRLGEVETVGDVLQLAKRENWPLGWLPPVDHASKMAKAAGRPEIAQRLKEVLR